MILFADDDLNLIRPLTLDKYPVDYLHKYIQIHHQLHHCLRRRHRLHRHCQHHHDNGGFTTGSGDNDLTNLNWLQDVNLVKKVYSTINFQQQDSKMMMIRNQSQNQIFADKEDENETKLLINDRPTLNYMDDDNEINHINHHIHNRNTNKQHDASQGNDVKPPYSYSMLIFMAIESSPTRSMMVRDIYKWIINQYPFFLTARSGNNNDQMKTEIEMKNLNFFSLF